VINFPEHVVDSYLSPYFKVILRCNMTLSKHVMTLFLMVFVLVSCSSDQEAKENMLRLALTSELPGLDPLHAGDATSVEVQAQIYEPLFQYAYLKRPYQLEPLLAESMPLVSDDQLTYTIRLKKGVFFQDDPAFVATGGKGREVVVQDIIYQLKRIADVNNKSSGWSFFDGRIKGLDKFRESTKGSKTPDYSVPVEGLEAVDKYTLRITLVEPYPQLLYILAMPYAVPMAKEVVDYYGEEVINHPVGTGPFKLQQWIRNSRILLVRNPTFRGEHYPTEGEPEDKTNGNLLDAGQPLPFVDKVQYTFIMEDQPLWLNFMKGKLDFGGIPKDNYDKAVTKERELTEEMRKKGIILRKSGTPVIGYIGFNMEDPILGKNKYLRQALCLSFDVGKYIELFSNNRARPAQMIIPPDFDGYDPGYLHPYLRFDIEKAKALLAKAGFPEGKGLPPLQFDIGSTDSTVRQMSEFIVKQFAQIGVVLNVNAMTWPQFLDKLNRKQVQVFALAWNADYPDAENFLQLLYGPNASPGNNHTHYHNPAFDSLYEKVRVMPPSPQRTALYRQMALMINEDCPMLFTANPISFGLRYDWVRNSKRHPFANNTLKYIRIDTEKRFKSLNQ
jgi:ABC-type transport system substrate-binding protein